MQNAINIARRINEANMTASLQFQTRQSERVGDPVKCRVSDTLITPQEGEQGARTTTQQALEVAVPVGTVVNAAWRGVVTFPDGATMKIFVKSTPLVLSNQSQYTFLATKVD
jgi:hypothetical protein